MNKWIYSSISLNLVSLLSIVNFLLLKFYPFDSQIGDIIGFIYFFANFILFVFCIIGYIIEYILYKLQKNIAFQFPYNKIKYFKYLYYPIFLYGLLKLITTSIPYGIVWIKNPSYSPMDVFVKLVLFGI